jgi:hypothetical protein
VSTRIARRWRPGRHDLLTFGDSFMVKRVTRPQAHSGVRRNSEPKGHGAKPDAVREKAILAHTGHQPVLMMWRDMRNAHGFTGHAGPL